eukprot:NODE_643_length_5630_cov_0.163623.p2 type:complete len:199 gc:universal NODE_643_length_5630_cov_0.163623:2573-3169(+)
MFLYLLKLHSYTTLLPRIALIVFKFFLIKFILIKSLPNFNLLFSSDSMVFKYNSSLLFILPLFCNPLASSAFSLLASSFALQLKPMSSLNLSSAVEASRIALNDFLTSNDFLYKYVLDSLYSACTRSQVCSSCLLRCVWWLRRIRLVSTVETNLSLMLLIFMSFLYSFSSSTSFGLQGCIAGKTKPNDLISSKQEYVD